MVFEVFGGCHPDLLKLINRWASEHGARLGADELNAPWCARSFKSIHTQRISVALQLAAAEEILDTALLVSAAEAQAAPASP